MNRAAALCCLVLALNCVSAVAAPTYNIVPLGFTDPDHTSVEGYRSSTFNDLNEAGQAIGTSRRFNPGGSGDSAWFYDGANLINIGLLDEEHTLENGERYSGSVLLNEAGTVVGHSYRYNGGQVHLGRTVWLYDGTTTTNIGPTGTEHTRIDDYKDSSLVAMNEAGHVIGYAERFNGTNSDMGLSVWRYDGTNTVVVGLTGPEHTRLDGLQSSTALGLTEAGHVYGLAVRYEGTNNIRGQSVWYYDGTTTIDIGLGGPEHTKPNGYKVSGLHRVNEAGQVVGNSNRYNFNGDEIGFSAWLYDGQATVRLGLTGAGYVRNDGYMNTSVSLSSGAGPLNEAGQVVGRSFRFSGASPRGVAAWLYDGANTIEIGLTGLEHTATDGTRSNGVRYFNQAGQVVGAATRYNGSVAVGESVWLYNGTTNINVGLAGPEHTRNDGSKFSSARHLNEAGHVVGLSSRYNGGSANLGDSVWLYNGTTTVDIGLTGAEYTRNDGYKDSHPVELNNAGQVAGYSDRFNGGSADMGKSAWLHDGATTLNIGLTGDDHTDYLGYRYSEVTDLNQSGQVAGFSNIYNDEDHNSHLGQDAWLYDSELNQTFQLRLSTAEDGEAYSYITYLGEDGLVLGTYVSYEDEVQRAFYFTVEDGMHDLGSLVAGGLTAGVWDILASAIRTNGLGQIVGYGSLATELESGFSLPYLLTPIAPSPGDFNGDGAVDAADYTVWRDHLGSNFDLGGNGDESGASAGIIDAADYNLWKAHFSEPAGSGASTGLDTANIAVPEPTTLSLAALIGLAGWTRKRLSTGV